MEGKRRTFRLHFIYEKNTLPWRPCSCLVGCCASARKITHPDKSVMQKWHTQARMAKTLLEKTSTASLCLRWFPALPKEDFSTFPSDNRAWTTPYYMNLNMSQNALKENKDPLHFLQLFSKKTPQLYVIGFSPAWRGNGLKSIFINLCLSHHYKCTYGSVCNCCHD